MTTADLDAIEKMLRVTYLAPGIADAFAKLRQDVQYTVELLKAARCPNCDGSGCYIDGPPDDPQLAQCEWCCRVAALTATEE